MIEIIECPRCQRKLRLEDTAIGQTVQCPSCQNAFTAAPPNPVAPPPTPRPRSPEDDQPIYRPLDDAPRRRYDDAPPRRRYEEDDEDYPRRRRSRFEDDYQKPHRGAAVLTLGILGLVLFFSMPGFVMAIVAIVLGVSDLRAMNRGEMREDGRGLTKAGLICAIIALTIEGITVLTCCGLILTDNL